MGTTQSKATKRQYVVEIQNIPGTWRGMTGAGVTAEYTKDYDGGNPRPDLLPGLPSFDDIEVVRTVRPSIDNEWIDRLIKRVGLDEFTITKQFVDPNGMKVGKPRTYPACLLTGLQEPEVDGASSDAAEITLTFATSGPA